MIVKLVTARQKENPIPKPARSEVESQKIVLIMNTDGIHE